MITDVHSPSIKLLSDKERCVATKDAAMAVYGTTIAVVAIAQGEYFEGLLFGLIAANYIRTQSPQLDNAIKVLELKVEETISVKVNHLYTGIGVVCTYCADVSPMMKNFQYLLLGGKFLYNKISNE